MTTLMNILHWLTGIFVLGLVLLGTATWIGLCIIAHIEFGWPALIGAVVLSGLVLAGLIHLGWVEITRN